LERSTDGIEYENLQELRALGTPNKIGTNRYAYLDQQPSLGYNYYRLGPVDREGNKSYSKVIALNFKAPLSSDIQIQPNPVVHDLFVNFLAAEAASVSISVFDTRGTKVLEKKTYSVLKGMNTLKLAVKTLPEGVFILQINQGLFSKSLKFVKKYNY
jgi:hypothetical protein